MRKITKSQLAAGAAQSISAVFVMGGLAAVGYGCWQIYEPAAYIAVGAVVVYMGMPD